MKKETFLEIAATKFDEWTTSQEGQTSGYEYEKSFDKMMVELGQLLLQSSVGKLPDNEKKTKDKN